MQERSQPGRSSDGTHVVGEHASRAGRSAWNDVTEKTLNYDVRAETACSSTYQQPIGSCACLQQCHPALSIHCRQCLACIRRACMLLYLHLYAWHAIMQAVVPPTPDRTSQACQLALCLHFLYKTL